MGNEQYLKKSLKNVATLVMGQSPPGSTYNESSEGIPFYQGVRDFGERHPTRRVYCTAPTRFAKTDDILFSVRAPIGEINRVTEDCSIGRGLAAIRADSYLDTTYIEYVLRYIRREWEILEGQGAVFGNAKKSDLENLPVPWPGDEKRRAIAHILGSLDDKIELNRQMNKTLEAMAQAIFKSWFVDFDPVRAKAEGRDPLSACNAQAGGLPKDIADLFPDSFEDSEMGEIPKGWEVSTVGDILELAYGKALKASNRRPGTVPVYGSNGRVGWHDEKLVQGPGIVVGRKGNPGIVAWVPTNFFPIDTTFYVAPKDSAFSILFLFYALQGQNLPSLGADSAVPGLNRNMAYMNQWVIPPAELVRAFDNKCFPLYDKLQEYNEESLTLTALRDTLLPKLISGELRVPDAEKCVEDLI
ncbi:MAG: hypothetical protein DDT29_01459 [Dehalococcoidia bacterium]|nr:hypothetical protein [Bacillota bacterium]